MKQRYFYLIIVVFFMLGFLHHVSAQNLAQEAYAIFEQSCLICHGENGSYKESLIIEHNALIDDEKIIPGDPDGSVFYQRLIETNIAKRMPLGQPPLSTEAIETIRQWIAAGAPDWNAIPNPTPNFITTEVMLQRIETHINSLTSRDRSFARYFTLTHLHNAGETAEVLNAYRRALSKLINSLSWGREVVKPQSIDVEETIYYIDLRDYEWDVRNDAWTQIEQKYPYNMPFDAPSQTHLLEKLRTLQQEMNCNVPFVHVDWFLATASLPPLYHDILQLPLTAKELEEKLEVSVSENIQNAPGKRVWRAGFNDSGVSNHNRVVERHTFQHGAYWKSYDFAGSAESQNIFTHPLDFLHDGGEIIFNLPNGLQAYFLVDGAGNRLEEAPVNIVSNPAASDPTVRNGLSCIGCHTEGMKTFEDEVRAVVEQTSDPSYDKTHVLDLYVEKMVMDGLLAKDTQRFRNALEAAGGVFGGIEPVQRLHEVFNGPLDVAYAAAAVGLETDTFLDRISKSATLQNLLGALVLENGTIKRDAWTSNFFDVISELNTPDIVQPPIVKPLPGASVNIPDLNLRAVLNRILDKPSDASITAAEMESFTAFGIHNAHIQINGTTQIIQETLNDKGIRDLTGLEFAINLQELSIERNQVSDLSPIAGLSKLRLLDIINNQIFDLFPIAELKELRYLTINHNPISDISVMAGLTQLSHLQMSHISGVSDISVLAGLINLQTFHCWGSPIIDMAPLVNLPKLEILDLCGAKLANIPSLENLESLKTLYLVDCNISDLSSLSSLSSLEHFTKLNLHRNNIISDISPLAVLTNLKWLNLSWNNISVISSLRELTNLEWLSLELNNISDVSPLAELTNLELLNLTKNPITDISPLTELSQNTNIIVGDVNIPDRNLRAAIAEALGKVDTAVVAITLEEMVTLTTLRASNRDIKDLTGLEHAINLEEMWISGNLVSDISPLSKLTNLVGLGAWETPISDLSPLAGLTKLRWLDFGRTSVLDLSPLAGITNLKKLTFYGCGTIEDLSPLADLTELIELNFGGNPISDLSPLAALINLEHLDFHGDDIANLLPLAGLNKLRHLDLRANAIYDVSPLAGLNNLESLNLNNNRITDISPLEKLPVFPDIIWIENPGTPKGGPKIGGPWLWIKFPAKHLNADWLAEASGGSVTEQQIATHGASEGKFVGNSMWKVGKIDQEKNNINRMLDSIEDDGDREDQVIYGSLILESLLNQQTNMLVGGGYKSKGNDMIKVWLNGVLVHTQGIDTIGWPYDYGRFFPITLNQGSNVLLVAIQNKSHDWSGFFGFEEGTEYTVVPPGVGFTFTTTETDLRADDTFTLNLNAENISDLAGWQADIAFDPDALEAMEVTEGDFLKAEGENTFFQGGTIDNTAGKITNLYSARISESGASGTGTLLSVTFKAKTGGETYVTLENFEFSSITGDIIPAVPPNITITVGEYPAWDVNQDGRVSIQDLVLVARDLGLGTPANLRTDVNRDGVINIQDLILVATHIGESTDTNAAPTILTMENKELTPAVVQTWIDQAKREDDGSLAFRQGIENLEKLLASLIPEKTALLANYPNPFNPETWIPYQLAAPADVTLTIYAIDGSVVRTLALGHQLPGIYQNRSRAAHWDGKNALGEPVASGLYFYTLTAGDFTATRKMLIRK